MLIARAILSAVPTDPATLPAPARLTVADAGELLTLQRAA